MASSQMTTEELIRVLEGVEHDDEFSEAESLTNDDLECFATAMRGWTCLGFLYVAAVVAASEDVTDKWREVRIEQGPVRGHWDPKGEVWTFFNIPYATAPTGKHKFKAPLPPPTWTEPFDAVDRRIACPQFEFKSAMPEDIVLQEDCLVTNVYVPDTKAKNLSVLVYIHGGGFQIGYGDWLKPTHLMKYKDMIVVNFNYRMGIHGYLCLGTEDVPGNAGMKDQVALLKWVNQNIAAFGGNPNDVTIAGYSAGSMSVDLLVVSKSAEGLFHKGIPESGSNLAAFATQSDPLQNAKDHAKTLNFTNVEDIYALEEFYKTLSYETMVGDGFKFDASFSFSPCVERDTGDGAFLTESPISIITSGNYKKVPLLYGFSNMEGLLRIPMFDEIWKVRMNEKFSNFLPTDLKFENDEEREAVAKQVKEFYFGDKPVDTDNVLSYVDFNSDVYFVFSTLWSARLYAQGGHNQVYLYEYSFVDEDTPVVPHTNVRGANHCAQTQAVLDGKSLTDSSEDDVSEEFKKNKKIMREIWHNFVTTGKPVPEGSSLPKWPAVGVDTSPYMSLGQQVELRGKIAEERTRFWTSIYEKHYREPIPPPKPPKKSRSEF